MAELTPGRRAAAALDERREELARAVTGALYEAMPELLERYGEAGRAKCLQDMRYNLEHLSPAVALGEPALFEEYVRWLDDMLRARHIPRREIARSLELTREVLGEALPEPEAAAVYPCLERGLAVLAGEVDP